MAISDFFKSSGFKLLALLKLSDVEYSIVLYIMNTVVSGLDQIITNVGELADSLDFSEEDVSKSLTSLAEINIVNIKYAERTSPDDEKSSMRINLVLEPKLWRIQTQKIPDREAVVYNFKDNRLKKVGIDAEENSNFDESIHHKTTVERIISHFVVGRSFDEKELAAAENAAYNLIDTHPVDQIIIIIKYFGRRIPTLDLLISSWNHYLETYLEEHHNVDLMSARKKHQILDMKFRSTIVSYINEFSTELNQEELNVLNILMKHKYPRRQLFWAYQARSKYPQLERFFKENSSVMLPVTSSGSVFKK